jgi:hypothetical protein
VNLLHACACLSLNGPVPGRWLILSAHKRRALRQFPFAPPERSPAGTIAEPRKAQLDTSPTPKWLINPAEGSGGSCGQGTRRAARAIVAEVRVSVPGTSTAAPQAVALDQHILQISKLLLPLEAQPA